MKNIKYLIIVLICSLVFTPYVNAAECDATKEIQLNRDINSIKVNYEVLQEEFKGSSDAAGIGGELETFYRDIIQVFITNLTDDFVVEVKNDFNKKDEKYTSKNYRDGVLSFRSPSIYDIINYTITIKLSKESGCNENLVTRKIYFSQPRYNKYSEYTLCRDIPDYYMCQAYVDFYDDVEYTEFMDKALELVNKKHETEKKEEERRNNIFVKIGDFIKENKTAFIIGGGLVIVAAAAGTTIVIVKRRRDVI